MKNKLIRIWTLISEAGMTADRTSYEAKSILLTNRLAFFSFVLLTVVGLNMFFMFGETVPAIGIITASFATAVTIFLNSRGKTILARLLFSSYFPVMLTLVSAFGKSQGMTLNIMFYLLPRMASGFFVIVPVLLFGSQNRRYLFLAGGIWLTAVLLFDPLHAFLGIDIYDLPMVPGTYIAFLWGLFTFTFLTSAGILFVQHINRRSEQQILRKNEELSLGKTQIEAQSRVLEKQAEDLAANIRYARRIQQAMLPDIAEMRRSLPESFVFFRPRDVVSGDFYYFRKTENRLYLAVGDCTGHGVSGAFVSFILNGFIRESVDSQQITSPAQILNNMAAGINLVLRQDESENKDGADMAFCVIEPDRLLFAGAKNPLLIVRDGRSELIKGDKFGIGGRTSAAGRPFVLHEIPAGQELQIFMYSDGFQDQFGGPDGRKFMSKPFRKLLENMADEKAESQENILAETLDNWQKTGRQTDDILVIGAKIFARKK